MDQIANYIQQLAEVVRQHVPAAAIPQAVPTAVVMLIFGVGVGVLGAKFARWLITVVFAAGGVLGGLSMSQASGANPFWGGLVGGLAGGSVGFLLHRIWVGIFTALFLSAVAFSVLSQQMIVPRLIEFDAQLTEAKSFVTPGEFHSDASAGSAAVDWPHLREYLRDFGDYLVAREPNVQKYAFIGVLIAGLVGFFMGMILCRMTLILFSAGMGTFLIASGIAAAGPSLGMNLHQTCQTRPGMTAMALVSLFLVSVVLQAMLTKPNRAPAPAKKTE